MVSATSADVFWYWVNERHRIYLKRVHGEKWPWTEDLILQEYKFCNVFRELDRGTMWLRENFREPYKDAGPDLFFNIAWYRLFNWIPTGEVIGWRATWDVDDVRTRLYERQMAGIQVFTNAHMLRGTLGEDKIHTYTRVAANIWKERDALYLTAVRSKSLENTFHHLLKFENVGPFLAYEIVTDLRHTSILDDAGDINTWANVGPGAYRGVERLFPYTPKQEALHMMRVLLVDSDVSGVRGAHVPPLELRDIEHSLCEFDKYSRVFHGEGKPRCRYQPPSGC